MSCGDGGGGDESGGVAKLSSTESSPNGSVRGFGGFGGGSEGFLGLGASETLGGEEAPWLDAMQVRLAALEGVIVQLQQAKGPDQQPTPAPVQQRRMEAVANEVPPFALAEAVAAKAAQAAEGKAEARYEELRNLLIAEQNLRVQAEQLVMESQEKINAQQFLIVQAETKAEEQQAALNAAEQHILEEQCRRQAAEDALENFSARTDGHPNGFGNSVELALAAEARVAAAEARALASEARCENLESEVVELRRLAVAAASAAAAVAAAAPQSRRGRGAASARSGTPTEHRLDRSGPRLGSPKLLSRQASAAKNLASDSTAKVALPAMVTSPDGVLLDAVVASAANNNVACSPSDGVLSDAVIASAAKNNVALCYPPGDEESTSDPKSSGRLSVSSADARAAVQEAHRASLRSSWQWSDNLGSSHGRSSGGPRSTTPVNNNRSSRPASVGRGPSRGPSHSPPRTPHLEQRVSAPSRSQPALGARSPSGEPRTTTGRQAPPASGRTPSSERRTLCTASTFGQRPSEATSRTRQPSSERRANNGRTGSVTTASSSSAGLQPGATSILAPVRNSIRRNQADPSMPQAPQGTGPSAGVIRRMGGVPAPVPGGAPRAGEATKSRSIATRQGNANASFRR